MLIHPLFPPSFSLSHSLLYSCDRKRGIRVVSSSLCESPISTFSYQQVEILVRERAHDVLDFYRDESSSVSPNRRRTEHVRTSIQAMYRFSSLADFISPSKGCEIFQRKYVGNTYVYITFRKKGIKIVLYVYLEILQFLRDRLINSTFTKYLIVLSPSNVLHRDDLFYFFSFFFFFFLLYFIIEYLKKKFFILTYPNVISTSGIFNFLSVCLDRVPG